MLVMIKLAAVQDAIISHVHQEHLRALSKMRLGQQTERLRSEVAGTVEEASLKSADLRIRVDGFAASTQTIVKGNHEIAATSNQRSEEHTSELQSLMRSSYAVLCLQTKNNTPHNNPYTRQTIVEE